ncbi:MAG: glutamate racemase [Gammaproteobacteria bacterium]
MTDILPTLLIFDSGIGGLSIADEIRARIPVSRIFYVADNAIFPYGIQEESVLIQRLLDLLPFLEVYARPDLIVIACNTASTVVLEPLRQQTRTPIIGVVPAIKPAAQLSQNQHIGLLATAGTVKRQYVQKLIDSFASHCTVTKVGSSELVHEAENKLRGLPVDDAVIAQALAPFGTAQPTPDVVVLGCTHFPFLRDEITRHLPPGTRLIDSGEAIARRAVSLLQDITPSPTTLSDNEFLFTADTTAARKMAETLHLHGFARVHLGTNSITEKPQKHGAT